MAIKTDDHAPEPTTRESTTTFASAPSASAGALDFLGLQSQIGIPRIDASVEPYLTKVRDEVKKYLPGAELVRFPRRENYHAISYRGEDGILSFFGMMFVSTTDGVSDKYYPSSMRMGDVDQDLNEIYPGQQIRLVDQRVIIANYLPEMDRWFEMANTIVMAFNVTTNAVAKEATISQIGTVEFSPDWSITNARAFADKLSPHGVRGRMDLGMVLRAKINPAGNNNSFGSREYEAQSKQIGVIGGYIEFKEKEQTLLNGQPALQYTPVFNITTVLSTIPLEGMWAILLAALAPNIYSSYWWSRQWSNFSKDLPNPGVLETDPERPGHPFFVESQEDMLNFLKNMCTVPHIAYQMQDGRDTIPGVHRMFSDNGQEQAHFMQRLMHFFEAEGDIAPGSKLCDTIEYLFDGVYGTPSGVLEDSREVDFLSIAARAGASAMGPEMRSIFLGTSDRPQDRAAQVQNFTQNFSSLYLNTISLINPTFIGWIVEKIKSRGLAIIDPNHQAEGRSFSSFTNGFGSGAGMGSVIQSGIVRPGLSLQSNWNRFG